MLVLAVLLTAAAVTVTGPIGFLGLAAPALVRLAAPYVPQLHRHRALIPISGLVGVAVVLGADVALRAAIGAQTANRNELYTDRVFAGLVLVVVIGLVIENVVFAAFERLTVRRWGMAR